MLYKKTPPVCRSKFKYPRSQYTKKDGYPRPSHNTDLYKRSVINMGTKLYNKLAGTQNKQTAIRPLRRN